MLPSGVVHAIKIVIFLLASTFFILLLCSPPFRLHSSDIEIVGLKTFDKVDNEDKEQNYLERNKIDVERVQRICSHHKIHFDYPVESNKETECPVYKCPIFVGGVNKFLYCGMAKVGISSMKATLIHLMGFNKPKNGNALHANANNLLERISPTLAQNSSYTNHSKYIIVRHPFKRLLSAYMDKRNKIPFRINYFDAVVRKQRNVAVVTEEMIMTFSEFVNYVLKVPSPRANVHWRAYWIYCGICEINYDYIIRMETMDDDLKVLYDRLGISDKVDIVWRNRKNSTDLTSHYFAELTKTQVKKLYDKFLYDFLLFDYSIEPYQSYAKDD